jgi:hypothetical protein
MAFIKQNLFLVILAAVVVVLAGVALAVSSGIADQVDRRKAEREQLAQRLRRLARGTPVSDAMVAQEAKRVEQVKHWAEQFDEQCVAWNRRHYRPLRLRMQDGPQTYDAFPIDLTLYRRHSGRYTFTKTYIERLAALRQSLRPTTPPTKARIEAATERWRKKLREMQRRREELEKKEADGAPDAPPAAGPAPPAAEEAPGWGEWAPTGARPAEGGETLDISTQAAKRASDEQVLRRAAAGHVYVPPVDSAAFPQILPAPTPTATDRQLWREQVTLWIIEDVVSAIRKTNDEHFNKSKIDEPNVTGAAVKRLVKIELAQGPQQDLYYTGRGEGAGAAAWGGEGAPPGAAGGPYGAPAGPGNLTQRISCKEYDVVHYGVTLVMPAPHLFAFQRHLLQRNMHTILEVTLAEPDGERTGEQAEATAELYYYGPRPVVEVRLRVELLLYTAWERGTPVDGVATGRRLTRDRRPIEWQEGFPPLMPVAVLRRLPPEALRDVDRRRIELADSAP